jgi:hypothetical protein
LQSLGACFAVVVGLVATLLVVDVGMVVAAAMKAVFFPSLCTFS